MVFNGAEILVRSLKDLGVKQIFGYTGAAILPVMDELAKQGVKIIVNANEQSAAFSAAGFSRSGTSVGVAIVTSGPAITNTLTAVADAYADSIPMIVIAGQVPEHKLGTDSFQHIDVSRVFGATAKKVILINSVDEIETVVKDAYVYAQSGKPGPVVLDMPINLQKESSNYRELSKQFFEDVYHDEKHLSPVQCEQFFSLLKAAKRPLLYLGGGLSSDASTAALRRFNQRYRIPSVNTLLGKGVIDEYASESMGMLGMYGTPAANMVIQENDFFFAIGVRWDDRVAEKVGFAIDAKIAYVDINTVKVRQIREERFPEFSVIGDAAGILNELAAYGEEHDITLDIDGWRDECIATKNSWPLDYNRGAAALQQAEVIELLSTRLPEDYIISTGVGNHQMLSAQYLKMRRPRRFLTSGSFGTMGFGLPSAIGACIADPEASVFVIDGDGSMRMNMGELHTVGTLELPVKILLLNNHSDGMVRNLENAQYEGRHSATERQKDVNFSRIAHELGFSFTRRVTERSALQEALEQFVSTEGNALLEVITDIEEAVYPIVPAGSSYKGMNLGPYIKKRNDD